MHFTNKYLLNPQHKVTVNLVGIGGTGSQVLSSLARIHTGLIALGHPGIHVRAWDNDTVSPANIGRQLYSPGDIGMNKAIISISRINRFFGFDWEAQPEPFSPNDENGANILITCVDTAKTRILIGRKLKVGKDREALYRQLYWLDFGNGKKTGQVVLGTIAGIKKSEKITDKKDRLKTVVQLFNLKEINEVDQGPSCSLAEAIGRQDLFINSTLANLGCNLLWKLFTDGKIDYHGVYLNLETMQSRPIKIEQAA